MGDACSASILVGVVLGTFLATSFLASALLVAVYRRRRRDDVVEASQHQQYHQQQEQFNPAHPAGVSTERSSSKTNTNQVPIPAVGMTTARTRRYHQVGLIPLQIELGTRRRRHKSSKTNQTFSVNDRNMTSLQEDEIYDVTLHGRPFEGLGFDIVGNMTDGIFVSRVLNRGPAYESGCIRPGDQLDQLTVSTTAMVFEDALTILSYASSYPVRLRMRRQSMTSPGVASAEHHLSTDTLYSTTSDFAATTWRSNGGTSTLGPRPPIDGRHTLPTATPCPSRASLHPVVRRSLFRSQSCSLNDHTGGRVMIGSGNTGRDGLRMARSTLALDDVPEVEFQLFGHRLDVADCSTTDETSTMRIRGRRGPRMGKRVGGLRRLNRISFSSDSVGSDFGLDRADDHESQPSRCGRLSDTREVDSSTMMSAGDIIRMDASWNDEVIESKSIECLDDKAMPVNTSMGSSYEADNIDGSVENALWVASNTWKYIHRTLSNEERNEGDETSTNNCSRRTRRHRWGLIVGDLSATTSTVVVVTSGDDVAGIVDSTNIEDSEVDLAAHRM